MKRLGAFSIYFTIATMLMIHEPVRAGSTCDSDSGVLAALTNRAAAHAKYAASLSVYNAQSLATADIKVSTAYVNCATRWIGKSDLNEGSAMLGSATYVLDAARVESIAGLDSSNDLDGAKGDADQALSEIPASNALHVSAAALAATIADKKKALLASLQRGSPTLGETVDWLKVHLPTLFFRMESFETISQTATYTFSHCVLSVSIQTTSTALTQYNPSTEPIYVISMQPTSDAIWFGDDGDGNVPLGQLDPGTILVKREDTALHPLALGFHDFQVAFTSDNEDEAERVAKAFRHAAELCGAKSIF